MSHGLEEEDIIGQCEVNILLQGKIVVGHRVLESFMSLRINLAELCGVRDLANGIKFEQHLKRKHKRFHLARLVN